MKQLIIFSQLIFLLFTTKSNAQIKHELGIGTGKLHIEFPNIGLSDTYKRPKNNTHAYFAIPFIYVNTIKQYFVVSGCVGHYFINYDYNQISTPTLYYTLYYKKRLALRTALNFSKSTSTIPDYGSSDFGGNVHLYSNQIFKSFISELTLGLQYKFLQNKIASLYALIDYKLPYTKTNHTYTKHDPYSNEITNYNFNSINIATTGLYIGIGLKKKLFNNFSISAESTLGYSLGFINISPIQRLSFNYMFGR